MDIKTTVSRRLRSPQYRRLLCAWTALFALGTGLAARADNVTLPDLLIGVTQGFLEFTVEDYLATTQTPGRYEIQVNQLDPRLRMPMCDKELTGSLESPAQPIGRVTVRVRCDGSSPWTVFVPAQVRLFRDVVSVLYSVAFFIIPDFSKFDGAEMLVDGRNVTLTWVLTAIGQLGILGTGSLGLLACLLFQRREVSEVSV